MLALPLCLVLAAAPPAEAWIRGWVGGEKLTSRVMADFHREYDRSSPHAQASYDAEATGTCRELGAAASPELVALLARRLEDEKAPAPLRERAAKALGWLQHDGAAAALVKVASAGHGEPQTAALRALGYYGAKGNSEGYLVFGGRFARYEFPPHPVAAALTTLAAAARGSDEEVRHAALEALATHDGPERDAVLLEALVAGRDAPWVVPLLGAAAVRANLKAVLALRTAPNQQTRVAVAEALGRSGERAVEPQVVELLEDPEWTVGVAAARALRTLEGGLGTPPDDVYEDRALAVKLWRARLKQRR